MRTYLNEPSLEDWGEFRLLRKVVLPTLEKSGASFVRGDDSSLLPIRDTKIVLAVTSDAAPRPLVWDLGVESYSAWGWYSVIISASDLAAAGAEPLGFSSSVEAPASLAVSSLGDFFEGMGDACREFAIPNVGGNIRQAPRFECHGTAIGLAPAKDRRITRRGCRPGDTIVVIGPCGLFISAYLRARSEGIDTLPGRLKDALLRPRPKTREMLLLQESAAISAATDNSDGILGALSNIADGSQCGIEVEMNDDLLPEWVRECAEKNGLNPWNLMFFWGDWQVIVAVRSGEFDRFRASAERNQIEFTRLGMAIEGPARLTARLGHRISPLNLVRNENFTTDSYNSDSTRQVDYLLTAALLADS